MIHIYWIGSTKIEVTNLNEFREIVEELQDVQSGEQLEFSNKISDTLFAVEADYQAFHGLNQDCWDMVHNNKTI